MEKFSEIINYTFSLGKDIQISVKGILLLILLFIITSLILRTLRRIVAKKLSDDDSQKFKTVFSFAKYSIFAIITFVTLDNIGFNITAIFAASAALLIGVGLALQTLFQDIICGIFVFLDKTIHIGDVIEIDGKVFKVTDINLRTTKGVNIQNKVLIVPNHTYLTSTLYNWTQNSNITRENVNVGVAYGSDVDLVKKLLLEAAESVRSIVSDPGPAVYFIEFGDSSLNFRLVFTVSDSLWAIKPKSELHFTINRLFKENNITIPFPQRDVHLYTEK
jgi:small-conductance mechanosensitive channel